MTYSQLSELLSGRCSKQRKLGNNTYAIRREDCLTIRLHSTDILAFKPDGTATVNTGGWRTVTTKARLNEYLPSGSIAQRNGQWYWHTGETFSDGDTFAPDGTLTTLANPDAEKDAAKLRRAVGKYAKACAAALPLPMPGPGDCWHCHMVTTEGKPLGDATGNTEHLMLHIEESYVVPSLVYHAIQERNYGPLILTGAFQTEQTSDYLTTLARDYVNRAVRRYLYHRLGLAS